MLMDEILKLEKERFIFLDKMEKSYNSSTYDYDYIPPEIDILSTEIRDLLLVNKDKLPVDFIIEQLTKLGESPCLLNNDETGKFAIVCNGMQDIPTSIKDDIEITHWISNDKWCVTIREALNMYLLK